jgi:hypothetical protein
MRVIAALLPERCRRLSVTHSRCLKVVVQAFPFGGMAHAFWSVGQELR